MEAANSNSTKLSSAEKKAFERERKAAEKAQKQAEAQRKKEEKARKKAEKEARRREKEMDGWGGLEIAASHFNGGGMVTPGMVANAANGNGAPYPPNGAYPMSPEQGGGPEEIKIIERSASSDAITQGLEILNQAGQLLDQYAAQLGNDRGFFGKRLTKYVLPSHKTLHH